MDIIGICGAKYLDGYCKYFNNDNECKYCKFMCEQMKGEM